MAEQRTQAPAPVQERRTGALGSAQVQEPGVPLAAEEPHSATGAGESQRTGQLEHLEGARFLAALWVMCAHYLPSSPKPAFNGAVFRVNIAICFFVVASGFITHWAYGTRDLSSVHGLVHFYARRLGRIVPTFWLAMGLACMTHTPSLKPWQLAKCFLFVEQWFRWCPNGPSWFIAALLPSWLLYPLTHRLLLRAEAWRGESGLAGLLLALWALSFGPAVALFAVQGGNITMQQHSDMFFWPPAQLADFAIGACASALAQRRRRRAPVAELACLVDACVLIVVAVVFALPRPRSTKKLNLDGWEPMLDHGLTPLLALFLGGSSAGGGKGWACRLLGHRALSALGAYSFEAYIFQRPVHDVFCRLFDPSSESVEAFIAYMLTLWLLAGLYATHVQAAMARWLRAVTVQWVDGSGGREERAEYTPLEEEVFQRAPLCEASHCDGMEVQPL